MNRVFWRWCRAATWGLPFARQRQEAAQELYGHLEDTYLDLLDQGLDPDVAQRQALAAMGSSSQVRSQLFQAHLSVRENTSILRELHEQGKWTELYRGRDQERYLKLRRALDKAGIKYQADEFDMLSRMQSQVGKNRAMGQYLHGSAPFLVGMKQFGGEDTNLYTLQVRGRDLAAARQAEYALERDLNAAEPVVHQAADLSVLKAPLTQQPYKARAETERITKVKGRLQDAGVVFFLLGILCLVPYLLLDLYITSQPMQDFFESLPFDSLGIACFPIALVFWIAAGIYWWRKNR
mgnify:CR=1 FL=1